MKYHGINALKDGYKEEGEVAMTEVMIKQAAIDMILSQGEKIYPYEGCGVLLRRTGQETITEVIACRNAVADKATEHFLIDPLELAEIEKESIGNEYEIAGFYHTHPDQEAVVSAEDGRFMIPGMIYAILSVYDGHPERLRFYRKDAPSDKEKETGYMGG
ncbi:MAG: M67 family metallopeptidase [Lachnospiraceae bacterium]|nr:M67 family metallopeptidase [Lachnospiraceae bacterium]